MQFFLNIFRVCFFVSAATCEHQAIVELLLQHGANPTLTDDDNTLPADNTDNPDIQQLLAG